MCSTCHNMLVSWCCHNSPPMLCVSPRCLSVCQRSRRRTWGWLSCGRPCRVSTPWGAGHQAQSCVGSKAVCLCVQRSTRHMNQQSGLHSVGMHSSAATITTSLRACCTSRALANNPEIVLAAQQTARKHDWLYCIRPHATASTNTACPPPPPPTVLHPRT